MGATIVRVGEINEQFLFSLSKPQLINLIKKCRKVRAKKYQRRKNTKYGQLCKAMPLEAIDKFFSAFKPEEYRYKIIFLIQAFLGLRIGEAIKINLKDLNFQEKWIKIHSEKQGHGAIDFMKLHEKLQYLLLDYITIYEKEIQQNQGFLFWGRKKKHLSPQHLRTVFREICNRAHLTQIYGTRESINNKTLKPQNKGNLYLYTTHSLRHSFCQYLRMQKVPIEIAKALMRHKRISSTEIYFKTTQEEANQTLETLFTHNQKP